MKMLRIPVLCLVAGALLSAPVAAQTVDEIIAKNIEARGGLDKIKAIRSARVTGRMTVGPGVEAPFVWKWKRPTMFRLEFIIQGMTGVQAYDGKTGWLVMPFMGKTEPEAMSEEDLKQVDDQADFEGPLVDYKTKGHAIELVGKEPVEGTEAWKLKVTRKSGDVSFIWLDSEAFLEIKEEGKRKARGQEMEFESTSSDYKEVGGVLFPHSIESKPKGAPEGQVMTLDKIELNVDFQETDFKMPEVKAEVKPEAKPEAKP